MFSRTQDSMPTFSAPPLNGSASSISLTALPTVSSLLQRSKHIPRYTFFSYLWVILSLASVAYGYRHCKYNRLSTSLICPKSSNTCELTFLTKGNTLDVYVIDKSMLLSSEQVRVDKLGNIVDVSTLRRKAKRNLFYSYALTFLGDEGPNTNDNNNNNINDDDNKRKIKTITQKSLGAYNMGRKRSQTQSNKLSSYIRGDSNDLTFSLTESKDYTWQGVTLAVLGVFFGVCGGLMGDFNVGSDRGTDEYGRKRNDNYRYGGGGGGRGGGGGGFNKRYSAGGNSNNANVVRNPDVVKNSFSSGFGGRKRM